MSTVAITTPASVRIYQRDGLGQASIAMDGTFTGTAPTHLEARFNGGTWTLLSSESIGVGVWSGTLPNQAQGDGTLDVRFSNDVSVTASVTKIGIGDVFLIWGDSLCATSEAFYQSLDHANRVRIWAVNNSAWFDNTALGFPFLTAQWLRLYEQLVLDQAVPLGFFQAGSAGSTAEDWAPGGTLYNQALAQVSTSGVNAVRACLAHIGTNNVNGGTTTASAIHTAVKATADGFVTDVAGAPITYVGLFPDRNPSDAGGVGAHYRAMMDAVRQGLIDSWAETSLEIGPNTTGQAPTDRTHPDTSAMSLETGNQWYLNLKGVLYGGPLYRSPRISRATFNGARDSINVTIDQPLSNTVSSSVAGYRAMDGGVAVTISSQQVVSSTVVRLTLASAIVGVGTVSFASADDAVGQVLPRSVAITLPDTTTQTFPQEPQFDVAVAETSPSASVSPSLSPSASPSPSPSASASSSVSPSVSASASPSPSASVSPSSSASRSLSPSASVSPSLSPSSSASPSPSLGSSPSASVSASRSPSSSASASESLSASNSPSRSPSPSPGLPAATPDVTVIC